MYRILVYDMDDTLIPASGTISEPNKRALERARQKGIYLVANTGRTIDQSTILHYENELPFPDFIIANSGASIVDSSGNHLRRNILQTDSILKVLQIFKEFQGSLDFVRLSNGENVIYETNPEIDKYYCGKQYLLQEIDSFEEYLKSEPEIVKVILPCEPNIIEEIEKTLKSQMEGIRVNKTGVTSLGDGKHHRLEITCAHTSKGEALRNLIEDILHFESVDMLAIGDGENDYSMIEYAIAIGGIGSFVSNAPNKIIEEMTALSQLFEYSGYFVKAPTVEEDGFAFIVEKWLEKK